VTTDNSSGNNPAAPENQGAPADEIHLETPDTPEACFSVPCAEFPIDLINACLIRADATLAALIAGGEGEEGYTLSDELISSALWAAQGWIAMARRALKPARPTAE